MLELAETRDAGQIERFLLADRDLHLYEIGDLDPFFWPKTRWFGAWSGENLSALALLYAAPGLDALLLLERRNPEAAAWLLEQLSNLIETRFYSHLSPGLVAALGGRDRETHGTFLKMRLRDDAQLEADHPAVRRLDTSDLDELRSLYAAAYPGNWFDPRMLETEQYFGFGPRGALEAVAGVHVFGPQQGVAAIGNVATRPSARGRGRAAAVTRALCRSLLESGAACVGLNVNADNDAAIRCYERLGFERVATYEEWMVTERAPESPRA